MDTDNLETADRSAIKKKATNAIFPRDCRAPQGNLSQNNIKEFLKSMEDAGLAEWIPKEEEDQSYFKLFAPIEYSWLDKVTSKIYSLIELKEKFTGSHSGGGKRDGDDDELEELLSIVLYDIKDENSPEFLSVLNNLNNIEYNLRFNRAKLIDTADGSFPDVEFIDSANEIIMDMEEQLLIEKVFEKQKEIIKEAKNRGIQSEVFDKIMGTIVDFENELKNLIIELKSNGKGRASIEEWKNFITTDGGVGVKKESALARLIDIHLRHNKLPISQFYNVSQTRARLRSDSLSLTGEDQKKADELDEVMWEIEKSFLYDKTSDGEVHFGYWEHIVTEIYDRYYIGITEKELEDIFGDDDGDDDGDENTELSIITENLPDSKRAMLQSPSGTTTPKTKTPSEYENTIMMLIDETRKLEKNIEELEQELKEVVDKDNLAKRLQDKTNTIKFLEGRVEKLKKNIISGRFSNLPGSITRQDSIEFGGDEFTSSSDDGDGSDRDVKLNRSKSMPPPPPPPPSAIQTESPEIKAKGMTGNVHRRHGTQSSSDLSQSDARKKTKAVINYQGKKLSTSLEDTSSDDSGAMSLVTSMSDLDLGPPAYKKNCNLENFITEFLNHNSYQISKDEVIKTIKRHLLTKYTALKELYQKACEKGGQNDKKIEDILKIVIDVMEFNTEKQKRKDAVNLLVNLLDNTVGQKKSRGGRRNNKTTKNKKRRRKKKTRYRR